MGGSPFTESSVLESKQYAQPLGNLMGAYFTSDNPTGTRAMSENIKQKQSRKGKTNNPNGRPTGIPNKSTTQAREAIAAFVDANVERMSGWLDDVAADEKQGPAVAFKMLMDVMEYHVPKLARTEHVGECGGPVLNEIVIKVVDAG